VRPGVTIQFRGTTDWVIQGWNKMLVYRRLTYNKKRKGKVTHDLTGDYGKNMVLRGRRWRRGVSDVSV